MVEACRSRGRPRLTFHDQIGYTLSGRKQGKIFYTIEKAVFVVHIPTTASDRPINRYTITTTHPPAPCGGRCLTWTTISDYALGYVPSVHTYAADNYNLTVLHECILMIDDLACDSSAGFTFEGLYQWCEFGFVSEVKFWQDQKSQKQIPNDNFSLVDDNTQIELTFGRSE